MDQSKLPEHVQANRTYWDGRAHEWVKAGERSWASAEPFWGCWGIPESQVNMLPNSVAAPGTPPVGWRGAARAA